MSKTTKLLPKLRFPEFREDGEWEKNPLANLAHSVKGKGTKLKPEDVLTLSGQHGLVRQTEYFGKQVAGTDLKRYLRIEKNDFVYNDRTTSSAKYGSLKRLTNYPVGAVSPIYKCFRFNKEEMPVYWEHYFDAGAHENELSEFINEGARAGRFNISVDTFLSISVYYSSKAEQQKIANCLGSLDDLITAHSRKLDALQDHKKGLLQQLFPAEGETIPELRFPEFEGEWKGKPLKKLATYQNGKAYEKHIVDEGKYVVVNSRFVSTDGKVKKFTNSEFCAARKGDVLMVLSDLPKGRALAKCFFVTEDSKYGVNQRVSRLQSININDKFLYYRLNRHRSLLAYDDGITQTHLSKSDVEDCVLSVPSDLEEQLAIAECLTALDALITTQTEQIAALKTHKNGLMQQLFPNPEQSKV